MSIESCSNKTTQSSFAELQGICLVVRLVYFIKHICVLHVCVCVSVLCVFAFSLTFCARCLFWTCWGNWGSFYFPLPPANPLPLFFTALRHCFRRTFTNLIERLVFVRVATPIAHRLKAPAKRTAHPPSVYAHFRLRLSVLATI